MPNSQHPAREAGTRPHLTQHQRRSLVNVYITAHVAPHPTGNPWESAAMLTDADLVAEVRRRNPHIAHAVLADTSTPTRPPPALLSELQAAHAIIKHALAIMTTEQKAQWGRMNALAGIDGEGVTRANERAAVIERALSEARGGHAHQEHAAPQIGNRLAGPSSP